MLIVSNKYRLASLVLPKCASTTVIALFAELHGLPVGSRERRALEGAYASIGPEHDRAADLVVVKHGQFAETFGNLRDYAWFSVVRDPYGRLLSNYYNKINRFSARFRCDLYLRFKLLQALKGPAAWRDVRLVMPFLRKHVSYHDFVGTLGREGVDWDIHYRRQSRLLRLDRIGYTQLLRMENLQDELPAFLRQAGLSQAAVSALGEIRTLNRSGAEDGRGLPEELAERPRVYDLYRDDFERLGYAR